MKRIISIILVLAMTFVMLPITAQAATDGYYTYKVEDGMATITDVEQSISGDVVIPDKFVVEGVGEFPVVAITASFAENDSITSVVLPEGISEIGYGMFENCSALTSVVIPESVTCIREKAFSNSALTDIVLPKNLTRLEDAFPHCDNLSEITIPGSVKEWDYNMDIHNCEDDHNDGPFSYCKNLKKVVIEEGVEKIGSHAFDECTNLTEVILPNSLTDIDSYAFWGTGITNIILPKNINYIGNHAFSNCDSLTSIIIPNGVTSLGSYSFSGCDSLTDVTIPDSVIEISYYSPFENCPNLQVIKCFDESAAEKYAEEMGFLCKYLIKNITDPDSGISIAGANYHFIEQGSTLTTSYIEGMKLEGVTTECVVFDMAYLRNAEAPADVDITVSVPISNGFTGEYCKIYKIKEGKLADEMTIEHTDTMISFNSVSNTGIYAIIHEKPPVSPGDVNTDGIVNLKDASVLIRHLAGWTVEINIDVADVSGDGAVNLNDVARIIKYAAGYPIELL